MRCIFMPCTVALTGLFFLLLTPPVQAWEPCKPFCDKACSGNAIASLSDSAARLIKQWSATCNEHNVSLSDASQAFLQLANDVGETYFDNSMSLLSGLDAHSSKLHLTNVMEGHALSSMSDHITDTHYMAVKSAILSKSLLNSNDNFGQEAQVIFPFSDDLSCEACSDITRKEALEGVQNQSRLIDELSALYSFAVNNSTDKSRHLSKTLSDIETARTAPDTATKLMFLLGAFNADESKVLPEQITRLMSQPIADHVVLISPRKIDLTGQSEEVQGNAVLERLNAFVFKRHTSPASIVETALISEKGLLLKRVALTAERNHLLMAYLQILSNRNKLLASIHMSTQYQNVP